MVVHLNLLHLSDTFVCIRMYLLVMILWTKQITVAHDHSYYSQYTTFRQRVRNVSASYPLHVHLYHFLASSSMSI